MAVMSGDIGADILRILGIDAKGVRRILLDVNVGSAVVVHIERFCNYTDEISTFDLTCQYHAETEWQKGRLDFVDGHVAATNSEKENQDDHA